MKPDNPILPTSLIIPGQERTELQLGELFGIMLYQFDTNLNCE